MTKLFLTDLQTNANTIRGANKMKLYDIEERYRAFAERLEAQDGELTEQDFAELDGIEEDFTEKANNYAGLIKELEAESKALSDAAKSFKERAERKANTADYLRERLKKAMEFIGKDKVETINAVVSFRRSQSVEIVNDKEIPEAFLKVSYAVDKAAIKDRLKSGEIVPGAVLKENRSLQIK